MATSGKYGGKSGRDEAGRFAQGNKGKPKGARHRTTRAVEALLEGEAEQITRKVIELALEGDPTALRLSIERLAPARKDSTVTFDLPQMNRPSDAVAAIGAVTEAVANGQLTPAEALKVAAVIETFRRTLDLEEIAARLEALEARNR